MAQVIAYLRVSTQRQHRSGLGIEAQRAAIERFAATEALAIIGEYTEAETGKGADALDRRSQLAAALAAARKAKCSIVVSKLDPAFQERGLRLGPDGPAGALHGGRTRA
jgi:DNA invertase Pin-like site-specific DNA recombinase